MSAHASTALLNSLTRVEKEKGVGRFHHFLFCLKVLLSSGSGCKVVAAGLNNVVDHMVCFFFFYFVVDPICKDGVV